MSTRDDRPRATTAWLVLLLAVLTTALVTWAVASAGRARDRARFDRASLAARQRVSSRLEVYVALLRGTAGMLAVRPELSRAEFAAFVERLDLRRRYPGIQGIGLSRRVAAESLATLEADLRAQGMHDFRARPTHPRAEHHAIVYLEPLDRRNRAAIGFDMFTNPVRREAMTRARDQAEAAMSAKVFLVQEIDPQRQAGFLIYVPLYRGGTPPPDVATRRAALTGFAYAPFRVEDFLAGIFGREEGLPDVALQIFDGARPAAEALLHDTRAPGFTPPRRVRGLVDTLPLDVAGRRWTIIATPGPGLVSGLRFSLAPVVGGAGLLLSVALFGLARARRSAELAREEAVEANRAKSAFLAAMSHELRTPLNAIGGYVELLEMGLGGPVTEQQAQYLGRMRRSQQHLLSLINDVLNFAKLEAGRVEYDITEVRLADVVAEVVPMIEPQLARKGLAWQVQVPDRVVAHADREKVRQVLINLLSNAVKFTERGSVTVDAPPCDDGAMVCVRVTDTGVGVAAEKQAAMFDPFVQVHRRLTHTVEGTGLGLAISRDLARAMGGDLVVESEEGRGAAFTLLLPAVDVRA
ncbi:MAG TPA: CHASE domain-containing protein [Gemmatimonadaceae bacterium]|nr:CHASE domain-containing protein [Gemmatimonadaceae bacterium]